GGERPRYAFPRILLQDAHIIRVDEAPGGRDPVSEKSLTNTVLSSTKDKTIVWITHHLTGVDAMDEIVFLKDGNISLHGHHEQLLQTSSYYKNLYAMDQGTFLNG